MVVKKLLNL